MQFKFTGASPTSCQPPGTSDRGNLLFRNDSLTQSATSVIGKALSSIGLSYEKSYSVDECMICLETMDEEQGDLYTVPACSHTFHKTCIAKWKTQSRKCPCCRGQLPDDIGPTLSAIRNPPAEDAQLDRHENATCSNVIFCPLGVVYPLFLLACFIAYVMVYFFMVLLLSFWMGIYKSLEGERNLYSIFCVLIVASVLFPVLMGCMYLVILFQILYMLFRIVKFYVKVSMCKIRWIDAYSFIIIRTICMTGYHFESLY